MYIQLETLSLQLISCIFIPQHSAVHNITTHTHTQFKLLVTLPPLLYFLISRVTKSLKNSEPSYFNVRVLKETILLQK